LTLDEFHNNDIEGEVDPPRFTQNRIREARAKAIVDNNVELLTSGALDNPRLKGKNASRWRRPRTKTEHEKQYAEMYQEVETELKDTLESDIIGVAETEPKNKSIISFTRAEQLPENHHGISTLHAEIHYPRGHNNRPVILPNQATAEELAAPTQKPEDKLNFEDWKAGVPDEAADELACFFRTDDEVREREAVFNAQNKEYIDTQHQKENDRLLAEAASKAKLEDEAAQEEKRGQYLKKSRSRKRKDGDPNELTTEEALLEVVRTRKISRKINYDALSNLFDDTGNFSLLDDKGTKEEGMV